MRIIGMNTFSQSILHWYSKNKRALPWRNTNDPYKIWISEIMLQQTRVAQGLPYYTKFIEKYPTVQDLALAKEEEVLKLWQGLGYYSRARNLHATAKFVTSQFQGSFPASYDELIKLKGIGDYTASAIASICFGEAKPVVDGNVFRVLARYFGVGLAANSSKGIKYFKDLAAEVMDVRNIEAYNQGIMEFGAIQCKPQNPDCDSCPLYMTCYAKQQNKIRALPVKIKKAKVKIRHFNYLVLMDKNRNTVLNKRNGKGIWQNLYEFPLIESANPLEMRELLIKIEDLEEIEIKKVFPWHQQAVIHKLSHQHLKTRFWIVETNEDLKNGFPINTLEDYPVPVLIADFIETFKNSYF